MFQELYIVNHNYHPIETLIASAFLFAIAAISGCIGRAKFLQLNAYLKTLRIRSIAIYAAAAQAFGLDTITHENHRILEEILELLAALRLPGTVFKLKSLNNTLFCQHENEIGHIFIRPIKPKLPSDHQ